MASSEKEIKRMEDDLLFLSKLYTATLGTLEDILELAGVKMAPEKATQRVLV